VFPDTPEIVIPPVNKTIRETLNTSFYCEGVGNPEPQITWAKRDGVILNDVNVSEEKLNFINVSRVNTGAYVCTASNFLGNDSVSAKLDVQCK
jgi:hypothetical protein